MHARVFDSKWHDLTTETEIQLAQIYGDERDELRVEICPAQQQDGTVDCGVFAIAFATDLCSGLEPVAAIYDQEKMRQHLLTCLQNRKLLPFPRMKKAGKINSRVIKTISLYCSCRLPEEFDSNMV